MTNFSFRRYTCRLMLVLCVFAVASINVTAQTLSLDECRRLALENNKLLASSRVKQEIADNAKEIARAQYLPKVDAVGGYMHTSKDISILNRDQKGALSNMGTSLFSSVGEALPNMLGDLIGAGLITMDQAETLKQVVGKFGPTIANGLNQAGNKIVDDFKTDTKNIWAGSIMVTQPIFTGGRLTALNKIADINRSLVANETDNVEQEVLINTEKAYWLVVSLKQKQKLAQDFHALLVKLHEDVEKMVDAGVATKADELSVDVKVNEAEMTLTQVDNGLSLSKMALCQMCGIPINSDITLTDEGSDSFSFDTDSNQFKGKYNVAIENRPEIKMLENASALAQLGVKMARADYMPTFALTGGYMISNPNVFNGFERKFSGVWNIGVVFRMPIWNWFETKYKIRTAKAATNLAEIKLSDAKELIELQVNQNEFKLTEAQKRVSMTQKNIKSAEENLRAATLGFKEGVMTTSNVLEAQTAWLKSQTQKIDAEIDLQLATAEMKKSLGLIKY